MAGTIQESSNECDSSSSPFARQLSSVAAHDDTASFYATPLNATINDPTHSPSSASSLPIEEFIAKYLNVAGETTSASSSSSCSGSPRDKMLRAETNVSGGAESSQLLVTASEGGSSSSSEASFEINAAIENTITNACDKESLLECENDQKPFSIKQILKDIDGSEEGGGMQTQVKIFIMTV